MADAAPRGTIMVSAHTTTKEAALTLIWFVVWLVSDLVGDRESLTFDPVNGWAAALLLCIALDLGRQHAPAVGKRP
jgi:hypothetical protein